MTRGLALGLLGVLLVGTAPQALADSGPAINGRYQAVSNGDFAKTNDVYRDLPSVVSVWTIESTCTDPQTCTGRVISDAGWEAELVFQTATWKVRRVLPDWQHCPDGTARPGYQLYRFFPMADGEIVEGSPVLGGDDTTTGEPGACGVGYPVVITMPFRLVKLPT